MYIPVGNVYVHKNPNYTNGDKYFMNLRFVGSELAPTKFVNDVLQLKSFTGIQIYHPSLSLYGVEIIFGNKEDVVWTQLKYSENIIAIHETAGI